MLLLAMKESVLGEASVRYVRGDRFVLFTCVGDELRESWDDHPYRVLFRSALIEDRVQRMEHRDEVLRLQGFSPQRPWQELFPLDSITPGD